MLRFPLANRTDAECLFRQAANREAFSCLTHPGIGGLRLTSYYGPDREKIGDEILYRT